MSIHIEAPVTAADHIRGRTDARITLVEYGDFECPYCTAAFPIVEKLRESFPDELRFVFRHAPQTREHPNAVLAAESAEAAGAQGQFWRFHDRLFTRAEPITWDRLRDDARGLELDLARFAADVEQHRFLDIVNRIERTGAHTVRGTPTFFLGDVRYEEGSDFASLARAIEALRQRAH
jgi:protein-disulfide isomerase